MKNSYKKISDYAKHFFESNYFHHAVNILTIINCIAILIILVIEITELSIIDREFIKLSEEFLEEKKHQKIENIIMYFEMKHPKLIDFAIVYKTLSILILSILGIFIIEIILKIIFVPKIFAQRQFEVVEALIVVISFMLNLSLLFEKSQVLSVISLITLIRLWRIGIVAEKEHAIVKREIAEMEDKNKCMIDEIDKLRTKLNLNTKQTKI
ncbi:voltage-gated hydrogen channel 1 [Brachionus plicatilis]|uniref:Voltage-gated hydrogen channel 1 n=1 Tax=Brachionus plicatilis TaxID=10195 RepID=A0A3M7RCS1_BRAPC|nr:voltage-gated hydrogen channel 1 [Brachionus plicatilis]